MLDLAKLREKRAAGEKGFTLIELLVVVVIIGILIAIAIPVYLNYKKGAADKSSQSDLRNAVNTLEQCNVDNPTYPTAITKATTSYSLTGCSGQALNISEGTTLVYLPSTTSAPANFDLLAYNANGSSTSGTAYCYASAAGGAIKQRTTALSAYAATC